jgi:hypothetical protein
MRKGLIKVKATFARLEAIYEIYEDLIAVYVPENDHERLLQEHAVAFWHKLEVMMNKRQDVYTMNVSPVEALSFLQLWGSQPMQLDAYAAVLINGVVAKLDNTSKNVIRVHE